MKKSYSTKTTMEMMKETRPSCLFHLLKQVAVVLTFAACPLVSFSQLRISPTVRESVIQQVKPNITARTQQTTLTLPFWDDFYTPHNKLYPDIKLWEDSYSVWVNNALGVNAPSLNVATFDGLDSAGLAYNAEQVLQNGFTDSLTSHPINLSENGARPVAIAERSSVFLSFYYQWQGNGEAPDPSDYLVLEFKDDLGKWNAVMFIKTKSTYDRSLFYDTIIQVSDTKYFHDAFQFRFKSFGRQSGPFDTWNIDYVYLNKNRAINDLSFPDQAAASMLSNLFENKYRAIPYDHFKTDPVVVAPKFDLFNLRTGAPDVVTYITEASFKNTFPNGSTSNLHVQNLNPSGEATGINDDGTAGIPELTTRTVTLQHLPTPANTTQFDPNAKSVQVDMQVNLITGDNINNETGLPAEDYNPNYDPIDFRVNDTISASYFLNDYYAYDDGHAEYAAGLIEAGNLVAYEFQLHGVDADTLIGFDVYFPAYGVTSNQTVEFFVYGEDLLKDKVPGQTDDVVLAIPPKTIQRKGINEFQRISFLPAILIETKKFYFGWREPVSGNVLVGLDINNDTGEKIFVNTNGTWFQNTDVTGSLMIRPIFGKGNVDPKTSVEEEERLVSVYPNPSTGVFYVDGTFDTIELRSISGQVIETHQEQLGNRTQVSSHAAPGLYILKCVKGAKIKTQKLIIGR